MSGFGRALRAEATKFRSVRGWVTGVLLGAGLMTVLGVLPGMSGTCNRSPTACVPPVGPGGQEVTDSFTYLHQGLTGDGSLTVRVATLTGEAPPGPGGDEPRLAPWAKAGVLIKDGTKPGSTYAAIMLTGTNGVRIQDDFTHDLAGRAGTGPRWLRLSRTGTTVAGAESADGVAWRTVGTVRLPALPTSAQLGLFVTSPQYAEESGVSGAMGGPTLATGTFDHVTRQGTWVTAAWTTDNVGDSGWSKAAEAGDTFTLSGSGDIAPAVSGAAGLGVGISQTLVGTFVALLFMVVVGAMVATGEYRRNLIRTSLAAVPRRGRFLAAKAVVLAAVTFVTGLAASAIVLTAGQKVLRANGVYVQKVSTLTEVRVLVGTAALLAVAAVFAMALGVVLRRGMLAVTSAVLTVVLPYLLAMTVLPTGAGQWLLRVTPAAAFAVQQATPRYAQVANLYTPPNGYFPLPPWAGLAVLMTWAVVALAGAALLLNRRDA
jgi:hypothetical protein